MLEELARETGASTWAIASMLFFLVVWLALAVAVWRARPEAMDESARLPLESQAEGGGQRAANGAGFTPAKRAGSLRGAAQPASDKGGAATLPRD